MARMIQQGAPRHSVNRAKQTGRKMVSQSVQKPVITWSAKEKRCRQADVEKLRRWLAWVDTWKTGVTFPGLKDGDRKAEYLVDVNATQAAIRAGYIQKPRRNNHPGCYQMLWSRRQLSKGSKH